MKNLAPRQAVTYPDSKNFQKINSTHIDISKDTLFDKSIKRTIPEAIKARVENNLKYNGKYIIATVNGKVGAIYEINNGTPIEVPLGRLEFSPKPNINFASIDEEVNSRV